MLSMKGELCLLTRFLTPPKSSIYPSLRYLVKCDNILIASRGVFSNVREGCAEG